MSKTNPIDPTEPEGGANPKLGDDTIRTLAAAVIEYLQKNHYTGSANVNGGYDDDAAGEHTQITFNAPLANDPANTANKGDLYIKDVSGKAELFFQDEDGDAIQITSGGKILFASLSNIVNNTYFKAIDAAGTGTVDLIKANASDIPVLPDGSQLATNAAPTEDAGLSNKKYVDDQIDATVGSGTMSPLSYAGEQSITFPNGLIMKQGLITGMSTSDKTITFSSAFPTACVNVQVTMKGSGALTSGKEAGPMVQSISAANFVLAGGPDTAYYGGEFYWIAMGY